MLNFGVDTARLRRRLPEPWRVASRLQTSASRAGGILAVLLVISLGAACQSSGRDARTLAATTFGRFATPPGATLVGDVYTAGESSAYGATCASSTRIYGTADLSTFQRAVYVTAERAEWQAAQSESGSLAPLDGMTSLFLGQRLDPVTNLFVGRDREEVQLSFWSSSEKVKALDDAYSNRIATVHFDWSAHPLAAVLEVFDTSNGCTAVVRDGLSVISGRVTIRETGLPLAGVIVTNSGQGFLATTATDGTYTHTVRREFWRGPYGIRIQFDAGPGYALAWWRDASTASTATVLPIGRERNVEYLGIDARMERTSSPSAAVINVAQRYDLARATTLTILRECPASRSATYCLNTSRAAKRDAALVPQFARALDADLAWLQPEAPATDYVVIVFGFGTPPSPGFPLLAGTYVAFVYDDARALLTVDTPRDEIAVRVPPGLGQLVASSR